MNRFQANVGLLAVTFIWSCRIVVHSAIPEHVSPWATFCVTSAIGAVLVSICFIRRIIAALRDDPKLLLRRTALLAVLNSAYSILVIYSLEYFDISAAAFSLSLTVVVLPIMLRAMRRKVSGRNWASATIVLVGIAVALVPSMTHEHVTGLGLMLVSCILRAAYIIKLNDYAREHDPIVLASTMMCLDTVFSFVPWAIETPLTFFSLQWDADIIATFFIYGYFIVGFATVLNNFAQRRASATESTIIYSMEVVFSIAWATILPTHLVDAVPLTAWSITGCSLIVLGNLIEVVRIKPPTLHDLRPHVALEQMESAHGRASTELRPMRDTLGEMRKRLRQPLVRFLVIFTFLLVFYLAIAMPFKVLTLISGFTDVRPVYMLQPVYGIFFGPAGCLASAVGNLIGDILSDSLRWSSIAGFVANFLYPYMLHIIWTRSRAQPFHLRTRKIASLFALSVLGCAIMQVSIISPVIALMYPEVDITLFAISVVINGTAFPIVFTIPFIMLIQEELGFIPRMKPFKWMYGAARPAPENGDGAGADLSRPPR